MWDEFQFEIIVMFSEKIADRFFSTEKPNLQSGQAPLHFSLHLKCFHVACRSLKAWRLDGPVDTQTAHCKGPALFSMWKLTTWPHIFNKSHLFCHCPLTRHPCYV